MRNDHQPTMVRQPLSRIALQGSLIS